MVARSDALRRASRMPNPRVLYGVHSGRRSRALESDQPRHRPVRRDPRRRRLDHRIRRSPRRPQPGQAGASPRSSAVPTPSLDDLRLRRARASATRASRTGLETGIPLRTPDGELIQGDGRLPSTRSAGHEARRRASRSCFSADGRHLVFGSKYAARARAPTPTTATSTIYDRDLSSGHHPARLDDATGATACRPAPVSPSSTLSDDGSRILDRHQRSSTDPAGNQYVQLLHAPRGLDRCVGRARARRDRRRPLRRDDRRRLEGLLHERQALAGSDTDTAADLYEAASSAPAARRR